MATYGSYVVCVLLCTVQLVHSVQLTGTIKKNSGEINKVEVSDYINGEDFQKVANLTLNRLMYADTLSTLTLANFKLIAVLQLTNISLEHVPVFENTICAQIYITRTKIKSIPANAFRGARPWRLDLNNNDIQSMAEKSINIEAGSVRLSCNKLSNFSQYWFQDPSSIFLLYLDGNRIEYLEDFAFYEMTKLSLLQLSYNHITSIGTEAFGSGITHLLLDFNNITHLTTDMIARREKPLAVLYLHHNQLSFLPEPVLLKLKPKAISLVDNPWQCQCLRDVERWLREHNSTRLDIGSRRGAPVCVVPRNFGTVCISAVDTELLETYARGRTPVQGCLASPCIPCKNEENYDILT